MSQMMLLRCVRQLKKVSSLNHPVAAYSAHAHHPPGTPYPANATDDYHTIGDREEVGFGLNGKPNYFDREDNPMPAIRFRPNTAEILLLREKEKGDWKKLTKEEKKQLYRASFCQTFAEIGAPTGEWKTVVGSSLFFVSVAIFLFVLMSKFAYNPPTITLTPEGKQHTLKRLLDIAEDPIEGLASKWDYENNDWKKYTQKK